MQARFPLSLPHMSAPVLPHIPFVRSPLRGFPMRACMLKDAAVPNGVLFANHFKNWLFLGTAYGKFPRMAAELALSGGNARCRFG